MLCKSVMLDARECSQCQKGFCKKCMNDFIDELIADDYDITCPNCGSPNMEIVEPHPVLQKQLSGIKASCENADKGCTEIIPYTELEKHRNECDYLRVKCDNFGCESEMEQKVFAEHQVACEFRTVRCDKCDIVKKVKEEEGEEEHDCFKSMAQKCEYMERKLTQVSKKLALEQRRVENLREEQEVVADKVT